MKKYILLIGFLTMFPILESIAVITPVADIMYNDDKVREPSTLRASPKRDEASFAQENLVIKISGYSTFLLCTSYKPSSIMEEACYEILQTRPDTSEGATIVGQILLQHYPQLSKVRLRHIEVDEKYRNRHHAGCGLETLFADLGKRSVLRGSTVGLEVSTTNERAISIYKKFGFLSQSIAVADVINMGVPLSDIKFPFYKK